MNVTMNGMIPVVEPIVQPQGCWPSFVSGLKSAGSWTAARLSDAGSAIWAGTKKAAIWAGNFFSQLGAGIACFAKLYARELTIAGIALAVGIAIALIFNRVCGCCNKPEEAVIEKQAAATGEEAPLGQQETVRGPVESFEASQLKAKVNATVEQQSSTAPIAGAPAANSVELPPQIVSAPAVTSGERPASPTKLQANTVAERPASPAKQPVSPPASTVAQRSATPPSAVSSETAKKGSPTLLPTADTAPALVSTSSSSVAASSSSGPMASSEASVSSSVTSSASSETSQSAPSSAPEVANSSTVPESEKPSVSSTNVAVTGEKLPTQKPADAPEESTVASSVATPDAEPAKVDVPPVVPTTGVVASMVEKLNNASKPPASPRIPAGEVTAVTT